jgi:DNA primase
MHSRKGGKLASDVYTAEQVERALLNAGVRVAGEISTHFLVFCEYHDNRNTASGEVDKETGQFYCFSCKSTTDLPHLIMKTSGRTYFEALRLIGDTEYNIADEVDRLLASDTIEAFDQTVIDRLHADVWGVGSDYFHSRNINDNSIRELLLGFSGRQQMVTVPVHSPMGILWGFVGRSIEGKRFKNNRGLPKGLTLFNLHRVWTSSRVFVVESSFDAIRLWQLGIPAVATLGAGITKEQLELLKRTFDEVILIPDNDEAGRIMTNKILEAMPYAEILTIEGAHDVGDLTDDDLTTLG